MATVSRHINRSGYVGIGAGARIEAAIAELGFHPNTRARSLATRRTGLIGFVVSDLTNPFTVEVARAIQDRAYGAGWCALICNTDGDGNREAAALAVLRDHGVEGVIVTPPETQPGDEALRALVALGIPAVLVGRRLEAAVTDRVTTDTYGGERQAVRHLIRLGHTRIAFVGGDPRQGRALGRKRGYTDELRDAGLDHLEELVIAGKLDREGGAETMARLLCLDPIPTAVVTVNDAMALGAIQEAARQGLAVPQDISVVGFDDIAMAAHALPPLTTVAQPKRELGQTAVDLLLARIGSQEEVSPQEVRLPCALVTRESTAPPIRSPRRHARRRLDM